MSEVRSPNWKTHWGSFRLSRVTSFKGCCSSIPTLRHLHQAPPDLEVSWVLALTIIVLLEMDWFRFQFSGPACPGFSFRYGFTSGDLPFPRFISASFYLASLHPLPSETQVIGSPLLGFLLSTSGTHGIEASVQLWYLQALKLTSWVLSIMPVLPIDLKYA